MAPSTSKYARIMVVGLDGASPDLLDQFRAEGCLPVIDSLIREGAYGTLESTFPPATFPAWTSFATGCNPGKHGIFDFTEFDPSLYRVRFVNSTHWRMPSLWRLLSDSERRVCVLNVPCTYPPEKVNGVLVAGFDSPVTTAINPSFVYPHPLFHELKQRFGRLRITDFQELNIGPGWHRRIFPLIMETFEQKVRIAEYLCRKESWDFFMALFGELDTVCHHFWTFQDGNSPRYDPGGDGELKDAIRKVYQKADEAVGRLLDSAPPGTKLVILSDHGFGGSSAAVFYLNLWLERGGYLKFTRSRSQGIMGTLKHIGLSFLPPSIQEEFFRRGSGWVANYMESAVRFGNIDWKRTTAFSEEMNYAPSIRINREGREKDGIVRDDRYEYVRDKIIDEILQYENPLTGGKVVRRAYKREEIYNGSWVHLAPDILLELALPGGYSYNCLSSRSAPGGSPLRTLVKKELLGAKGRGMSGSHRLRGILIVQGEGIRPAQQLQHSSIIDVAPNILHLLDLPVPSLMDGIIYEELFKSRWWNTHTPKYCGDRKAPAGVMADASSPAAKRRAREYTPHEEAIIRKRLQNLGYFE